MPSALPFFVFFLFVHPTALSRINQHHTIDTKFHLMFLQNLAGPITKKIHRVSYGIVGKSIRTSFVP